MQTFNTIPDYTQFAGDGFDLSETVLSKKKQTLENLEKQRTLYEEHIAKEKEDIMAVRCLVERNGKVLLCHFKKHDFYFLPGGSVEFQETLHDAIYREFREEMGLQKEAITIRGFVCLMEVMYDDLHSLDPIFRVDIAPQVEVASVEKHIDFKWFGLEEAGKLDLRPNVLKRWLEDNHAGNHLVYRALQK